MNNQPQPESFREFQRSFSYGSRNDLNWKFLSKLSEEEAATCLQELLQKLGTCLDDGKFDRLIDHVHAWQMRAYAAEDTDQWVYNEGPFAPLSKPLSASKLALLTSSGHFVAGDDPEPFGVKQMTQHEAIARIGDFLKTAPTLSTIPITTPPEHLKVRHGGYDIHGAQADPNVAFPLERLQELAREGIIGALAQDAYSFVGACAQTRLLKDSAPQWAQMLSQQQIDAVVLVPV
ncbi:hypothetical protein GF339_20255 [candidate division KSB3 bacterium]|uniref:Selenoprotein B glycine/betaine/sarcosine/D-proline reductase n=1 Tax=candidate division KSB3 bacterium TaxID=2044937 RepID=A0A9D5JZ72_9BACT|nr:hypothetical protein [candidate division KSB3 bacterium]MBD3326929.1 hypothetical protein [candidate division KSB3 bacterium]